MNFAKTLLAAAALTASVGANAVVTGSLGGGMGPFLALNTSAVDMKCVPAGPATCTLGASIATINGGTIYAADKPFADLPEGSGPVFGGRFLASGPTSGDPSTLTFAAPQSYVSFLWGSPDVYNCCVSPTAAARTTSLSVASACPATATRRSRRTFSSWARASPL
jgi:hypothetical protein